MEHTSYESGGDRAPVYAGFLRRWAALTIDIVIGYLLVFLLSPMLRGISFASVDNNQSAYNGMMWIILLVSVLYGALMESSHLQGTLGKLVLGIQVVTAEGERLSFVGALGRSIIKTGSVLFMGVGCLIALFTQKRQALHDFPAHSVVVRKGAVPEAVASPASYTPPASYMPPAPASFAAAPASPPSMPAAADPAFFAEPAPVLAAWELQDALVEGILPEDAPKIAAEFQKTLYAQLAAAGLPMDNRRSVNQIYVIGRFIRLDGGKRWQRYFSHGLGGKACLEAEGAVVLNGVRLAALYAKSATGFALQVFGGENSHMLRISAVNCAGQIARQAIHALAALRREPA